MLKRFGLMLMLVVGLTVLAGCAPQQVQDPPRTVIRMTATRAASTPAPGATAAPTSSGGGEATPAPQAQPSATTGSASSSSTEAPAGEKVTLEFVKPLSTIEQVDEIRDLLHDTAGILAVTGNELSLTFTYDPSTINVQGILDKMAAIDHEMKAP